MTGRDLCSRSCISGECSNYELTERTENVAVCGVAFPWTSRRACPSMKFGLTSPGILEPGADLELTDSFIPETQRMETLTVSNSWSSSPAPLVDVSVVLPRFHYIQVPHVKQLYNWDCGLACVLMVLRCVGFKGCDLKSLAKLCKTTSIWTIDLAHLLRRFSINVAFLTVTIGANPGFALESFYQENMEEDCERVNRLFEQAPQVGIQIQWRSICGEELRTLILSGRYLAIALVDKRKLSYPWLDEICLVDCCGVNTGYTGHYVVICGYDLETDEFEIRDPASSSGTGRISLDALDEARKSFGTDEDILFVSIDTFDADATMTMLSSNCPGNSI